jgi:hypothetical protein
MKNIMDKIHCEYCQIPITEWQPLESYQTDRSCEAYSDLMDVIAKQQHRPFTVKRLTAHCRKGLTKQFPGIPDMKALVKEFIAIQFDLGEIDRVRPGVYKCV